MVPTKSPGWMWTTSSLDPPSSSLTSDQCSHSFDNPPVKSKKTKKTSPDNAQLHTLIVTKSSTCVCKLYLYPSISSFLDFIFLALIRIIGAQISMALALIENLQFCHICHNSFSLELTNQIGNFQHPVFLRVQKCIFLRYCGMFQMVVWYICSLHLGLTTSQNWELEASSCFCKNLTA